MEDFTDEGFNQLWRSISCLVQIKKKQRRLGRSVHRASGQLQLNLNQEKRNTLKWLNKAGAVLKKMQEHDNRSTKTQHQTAHSLTNFHRIKPYTDEGKIESNHTLIKVR